MRRSGQEMLDLFKACCAEPGKALTKELFGNQIILRLTLQDLS